MVDVVFLCCICFFFSSRRRHTRFLPVSWARRCVQETGVQAWNTAETRPLKCPMCQQAFPLKGEEVDLQNSSHFGNDSLEEAQQEDKKDKDVRNLEFNFQNEELNDVQKLEENLIQKDLNLNSNKKLKANYNQKQQQQDQIEYGGSYYQFKNQL
eukprot:TRINITY_DN16608_c0_g1_i2.p2 TRINITY_DN16608_c0_g1~~TRINITY_DN16608_c0_g1_i2.p2  ORF type:complete len:154 (-),score=32.94 TRINITY_DN16608_c0_g1_i2:54-515(-)